MRSAAHHDHLADAELKIIVVMLCNDRYLLCGFPNLMLGQWLPIQIDDSFGGCKHAIDTLEEGTFAAAVRADDADELIILRLKIDSV